MRTASCVPLVTALVDFMRSMGLDVAREVSTCYRGGGMPIPQRVTEKDVDEAIAVCGGDPTVTIRNLLLLTGYLEHEADAQGDD